MTVADVLCEEFGVLGVDAYIDRWDENRANLIAQVKSTGRSDALVLACHLDVVGPGEATWQLPPFEAVESNGRIYGRGSADMKGGIAAATTAIGEIVKSDIELNGDIIFVATAGEENDSCGTMRFMRDQQKQLPRIAGVILPEPTDFDVVTAHRGMLWLEVSTLGKTAHGSTPQLGINAITSMRAFLNELDEYKIAVEPHELLGGCSMSTNTITGGQAINVIPDKCSVGIDIRVLPKQRPQEIIDDLEQIFARLKQRDSQFQAEVSVVRHVEALETDSNCEFVTDFCSCVGAPGTKAVGFTTDGPHFEALGAPVVVFGPGKPDLAHQPNEYIDIADVEKAVEHYKNIILKFLS